MLTHHSLLLWILFTAAIILLLILDLKVFHKRGTKQTKRDALLWSIIWTVVALIFNGGIWIWMGTQPAVEFFTGYLIERSLSMDNLFVFLLIFNYFQIDRHHQHTVLMWGILGAIVLRLLFILVGSFLVTQFHFVLYLFGALLLFSGAKLFKKETTAFNPDTNFFFRILRKIVPFSHESRGEYFFIRASNGRLYATPLLAVLFLIETSDVIFALDSIPAIFGITLDPFIIFSSNIFAILGLRALYHLIAGLMESFHLLHYGLAVILIFVGAKMLLQAVFPIGALPSLIVITAVLGASILMSYIIPQKPQKKQSATP